MRNRKPPFEITNSILEAVAEIAELVGHLNAVSGLSSNPMLRRTNRIRSIYSSLAIEQNTLSLEQVTAVLNGKRVIAPPKDIAEVKNAYEIYDMMDSLDPYSIDDLLNAHAVMTRDLVMESGCFRSGPVGVVDKKGNILHFGTLPDYVPGLMADLLKWTADSEFHMLIKSCVFHYELELIHPFADGNGRIGRLWHTLLLTQWRPLFVRKRPAFWRAAVFIIYHALLRWARTWISWPAMDTAISAGVSAPISMPMGVVTMFSSSSLRPYSSFRTCRTPAAFFLLPITPTYAGLRCSTWAWITVS